MRKQYCGVLSALFCGVILAPAQPRTPAVLFAGSDGGGCGYELANRLVQAGFALRADPAPLSERPLPWDQATNFTAWDIPFALAQDIAGSPVSAGIESLWYPVSRTRVEWRKLSVPLPSGGRPC